MMKYFLAALQFLTKFPVKAPNIPSNELGRSAAFFTLVGAIIGVVLALGYKTFSLFFPQQACAALVIILEVFIAGAIHLDGFADTIDGFSGGGKDKDKMLSIMEDSSIGSFGAIGVALLLILKFAAIAAIPEEHMAISLVMMTVFSRWAMAFSTTFCKPAKPSGLGADFILSCGTKEFIYASLAALVLSVIFLKAEALILITLVLGIVVLFNFYVTKKLGGATGDTFGAVNEIVEVGVLLVLLGIYQKGLG